MGRKGKNVKLYIATNPQTPTHLEVKRSGDIDLGLDKESEEYNFRGATIRTAQPECVRHRSVTSTCAVRPH